ncbi:MAG TPA: alpha-ribazole phosphatase family protein [Puia sp.]|nr:alpha-ribazole phosphatase family protein [Puia sp.]
MDTLYLIRHTTPAVARGICYGQTDLDVTESFAAETELIRPHLPASIASVYSSPLKRCSLLARELFPGHPVRMLPDLMEIDCGRWEMRAWDELPAEEVDPWMADFVQLPIPGGESYVEMYGRVIRCWDHIKSVKGPGDAAIVAHGGVIRSILAAVGGVSLPESFKTYSLPYGCVVRVEGSEEGWTYRVLSTHAPAGREQHKPKSFYR